MTKFQLFVRQQGCEVLGANEASNDATVFGLIYNRSGRWMAYRAENGRPVGEPIDATHLHNQPNGADLIAEALGL